MCYNAGRAGSLSILLGNERRAIPRARVISKSILITNKLLKIIEFNCIFFRCGKFRM